MDLSFLIPSKTRRQLLEYFVENPDAQGGIREIASILKLAPQLVYRELVNLENWGFLFSSKRGSQRLFRLNNKFPLYLSIREMIKAFKEEQSRNYTIDKTYDLKAMVKRLRKTPVPKELIPGLTAKRKKPRSWTEEKILNRSAK